MFERVDYAILQALAPGDDDKTMDCNEKVMAMQKVCSICGRPALFRKASGVKSDKNHDLCARHWRDAKNAMSAENRKNVKAQKC